TPWCGSVYRMPSRNKTWVSLLIMPICREPNTGVPSLRSDKAFMQSTMRRPSERSGGDDRLDLVQLTPDAELSRADIVGILQVQPELTRRMQRLREPKGCVRSDRGLLVCNPLDPGPRHAASLGERPGR